MTSQPHLPSGAAPGPSGSSRVQWWRMAFRADTWRRTTYVVLALPLAVVAVPVALLGGYRVVARWRRGLARRYLGLRVGRPPTAARVLAHALLSLPLDLASLALVGYLWLGVVLNLAYPLRPGTMDSYQHSWGGPTLAGAWAVHAVGGLGFLLVTPWVVRAATRLQGGLVQRLLGGG
jgi:hypothetical protein